MVEFTTGDLFAVPAQVRVNTVNCVGAMGKGVALQFRTRYPAMFTIYRALCFDGRLRPGRLHIWHAPDGTTIVNLPTKDHWRNPSEYAYIASGLQALRRYLAPRGAIAVALPPLGCGNGGLDWQRVAPMITQALGDIDARVLAFTPARPHGTAS